MGRREDMFDSLVELITQDSLNGNNYDKLGDYYLEENKEKAYLCYENALFLGVTADEKVIKKMELLEQEGIDKHKVSIVILSYNAREMMIDCIESIRRNNSVKSYELVVIDNASTDGIADWLKEQDDIVLRCNEENVGFPKGCNQGIELAEKDNDIMLLNNDTIVTENALFWLRMALCEPEVGASGSISNMVEKLSSEGTGKEIRSKNEQLEFAVYNNVLLEYPYEMCLFLRGYALLFKRNVLKKIGNLDERFSPGNFEDNDICFRILQEGYKLVMCYNSFIFHYGSASFNKKKEWYSDIYKNNYFQFNKKYGFDVDYYTRQRFDLIEHIQKDISQNFKLLDIGCGCGSTMLRVEGLYPHADTIGVEKCSKAVGIGSRVAEIYCLDIEKQKLPFEKQSFDYIFMGNVLEQLSNPHATLLNIKEYLKPSGLIIASVYNCANIKNIYGLLK